MLAYTICLIALVPFAFAVQCENKQVGIGGGYESVQENGGATCEDSEWCMTKRVTTADTKSIVTQCAKDEKATCDNFANDKCWEVDNGSDSSTKSEICCCKTHMCNKTGYKVGVRAEGSGGDGEAEGAASTTSSTIAITAFLAIVAGVVA